MDRHKISIWVWVPGRLDCWLQSYLPFSAEKPHIWPCPEYSLLSFNWNLMKLADNLDRHKISDEFKFQSDWTIDFGVTCPLVPKTPIFYLVQSIACLVFIGSLWKLQIIWTCIKYRTRTNSGKSSLELIALNAKIVHIWLCPKCSHVIFIQSVWNLQIDRTGIKYSTGWIGIALNCWHVWSQVSDCCPLGQLL